MSYIREYPPPPPEGFEHGVVLLETFTEFEEKGGRKAKGPLIIYRLWGGGGFWAKQSEI